MMAVFLHIFVADKKIIFSYRFGTPFIAIFSNVRCRKAFFLLELYYDFALLFYKEKQYKI